MYGARSDRFLAALVGNTRWQFKATYAQKVAQDAHEQKVAQYLKDRDEVARLRSELKIADKD